MSQKKTSAAKAKNHLEKTEGRNSVEYRSADALVGCGYALLAIAEALQNLAQPKKTEGEA